MIGKKIKAYIDERGIKQSFVAEKTGIESSVLSKMLNGNYVITAVNYYCICKALDVPMSKFFEE